MTNYADYALITKGLATGADPALICATCPWDRNCINPPMMTAGDIDQSMAAAAAADQAKMTADPARPPATALLMAQIVAGRDTALPACPVLVLRLQSPGGRKIADQIRAAMQSWDDQ